MNAKRTRFSEGPIIVKIGSESIDFESVAGREKISRLALEISHLMTHMRRRVILVTSGAVAFGRKALNVPKDRKLSIEERRALASIGQPILMERWRKAFEACDPSIRVPAVGQWLVTHAEIEADISHSNGLRSGIEGLWSFDALPILNENDFATPEEIVALGNGADNDKNAHLIAQMVRAECLAIMTLSNGIYARRSDPSSRLSIIHASKLTDGDILRMCGEEKSQSGTGGWASKLTVARDAANEGIVTHIFNGTDSTLLEHIEDASDRNGGTIVVP